MQEDWWITFFPSMSCEPIWGKNWKRTEEPSHPKALVSQWEMDSEPSSSHCVESLRDVLFLPWWWHNSTIFFAHNENIGGEKQRSLLAWTIESRSIFAHLLLSSCTFHWGIKAMNSDTALSKGNYTALKPPKEQKITQSPNDALALTQGSCWQ